jgi:PAS domain S-box-containing protein
VTNDVDFSVEWKAQLGFSDEGVPNGFSEIESRLHPEDRDRVMAAVAASIEDPSVVYSADFRLRHKDGSYRWMHGRALIVLDEQGRPVRMIGAHVDLTEQKNAEKQSFRSQRLESLGTLASGVAHDLNNALTPILMSIEMLRMDYPNETAVIDLVESNALRGANMVRQLLTFPRGVSSERVGVDVGLLITEIQNLMQGTFPKNLELRVTCESTLPIVLGDATQLHQVLLNLCVNARDAMPDGGTLTIDANYQRFQSPPIDTVTLAEPGDYIVVTVRDTGLGIPAEICEHIFDPFFTTKDVHKGTGLGLANVLAIVKGHSGFIKVQSQPEEGTTFTVFLPTRDDIRVLPSLVMQERVPHGRGELILFIEDEATIREVIAKGLARLNYRILTAVDGADGLAQVLDTNNDIAAVVTDMHMPNMDGLAMAQALRQHRPDMPILVTSGRMDDEVVAELYSLGVTQLLAKPFTKNQLALALEKLLQ